MKIVKLKNFNRSCTIRVDDEIGGLISFNGGVFKLNEISAQIVFAIEDGKKSNEITDFLSHKYDTDKSIVEKDVDEFMAELSRIGLYN